MAPSDSIYPEECFSAKTIGAMAAIQLPAARTAMARQDARATGARDEPSQGPFTRMRCHDPPKTATIRSAQVAFVTLS